MPSLDNYRVLITAPNGDPLLLSMHTFRQQAENAVMTARMSGDRAWLEARAADGRWIASEDAAVGPSELQAKVMEQYTPDRFERARGLLSSLADGLDGPLELTDLSALTIYLAGVLAFQTGQKLGDPAVTPPQILMEAATIAAVLGFEVTGSEL